MRRALIASTLVASLLPFIAVAQTQGDDMRSVIEADLHAKGVDSTMSAADFRALVDSLANASQKEGITPKTVVENQNAENFKNTPPLASGSTFDQAAQGVDADLRAASEQELAVIVAGVVALALLFGIWRRYKHLSAIRASSAKLL
jgi:hypothetical protein